MQDRMKRLPPLRRAFRTAPVRYGFGATMGAFFPERTSMLGHFVPAPLLSTAARACAPVDQSPTLRALYGFQARS